MSSFLAPTGELALRTALSQRAGGGKNHIFAWYLDPAHLIWTKVCMDILLDPRNKPAKEFFIFLKIQCFC